MYKQKGIFSSARALLCVAGCLSFVFNFAGVSAQTKPLRSTTQNIGASPSVTATLTDSFADSNGNGRAAAGEEVTYTATISNTGSSDATGVSFTNTIDSNTTLVPGSFQIQSDLSYYAFHCYGGAGGGGGCPGLANPYGVTDANFNTILGGYGRLTTSNVNYDSQNEIYQFDITVQNLMTNDMGTLDGTTLDANGIRLFVTKLEVGSGTGAVSVINADGTAQFTAPNQPYFQYNQILHTDQVSNTRTVQLHVPNTASVVNFDFMISTKVQPKLVINEVLVNPGGTIMDASGEWFELYNAGSLPIDLKNFQINDFTSNCGFPCPQPSHTIASNLIVQPGGYATLGNTTNTTSNGGVPIDYAYGTSGVLAFANTQDGVRIQTPATTGSLTIDQVIYQNGATSAQNGISRELKNPALDNSNMDGSNFANASVTAVYGPGGRGTPKAQNSTYTPFAETFTGKSYAETNFSLNVINSGETISANLGTIAPNVIVTVTYKVTVDNPIPSGLTQISNQGFFSGSNFGSVMTDDPNAGGTDDPTVTLLELAPTAAHVFVSGRVLSGKGAIARSIVLLVDSEGIVRTTKTNSFGYFRFDDLTAGETFIFNASAKGYSFAPQVVSVSDDITELNFTAIE